MHRLEIKQKLPIDLQRCWNFFSDPGNLKVITPHYLRFEIHDGYRETPAYAGQIISYTLYPLFGIPVNWMTEISHVEAPHYFIDVQLIGPYRVWHHEHRFVSLSGGVEVIDTVHYQLPFGPIGKLVNRLKVKRQLEAIFEFRRKKLQELFGDLK